ncbi:hypothetical protein FXV83_15855 [Bradyrhizobium hipponense]|uniref:Uncharacterized protein n=1 Tax=Bradyrhizobium hipponense TaxID=2605638 RepID=A0A5S4YWV6_9BRAD|nr:hypothetical protein [Bradyrhizobium hipponense]TYO65409.1 hypothetical protein FXV83_15855 [Bradyrhizobium hipponense]
MSDQQNTEQELLSFVREARKFLTLVESPTWAGSAELTDEEHVAEMATHLAKSRERLDLPERTVMHSVRNSDDLVLAMTGNTPAAAERARFLTGLLTALPRLLDAIEERVITKEAA